MMRQLDAPDARAASTNSFSRSDSTEPAHHAGRVHPEHRGQDERDHRWRAAELLDGDGQDHECGHDQEQVGQAHQDLVLPLAEVAGDGTGGGADDRRQDADRQADAQRDLAGVEDLGQLVAAEVVGAHEVVATTATGRWPGGSGRSWDRARSSGRRSRGRTAARARPATGWPCGGAGSAAGTAATGCAGRARHRAAARARPGRCADRRPARCWRACWPCRPAGCRRRGRVRPGSEWSSVPNSEVGSSMLMSASPSGRGRRRPCRRSG